VFTQNDQPVKSPVSKLPLVRISENGIAPTGRSRDEEALREDTAVMAPERTTWPEIAIDAEYADVPDNAPVRDSALAIPAPKEDAPDRLPASAPMSIAPAPNEDVETYDPESTREALELAVKEDVDVYAPERARDLTKYALRTLLPATPPAGFRFIWGFAVVRLIPCIVPARSIVCRVTPCSRDVAGNKPEKTLPSPTAADMVDREFRPPPTERTKFTTDCGADCAEKEPMTGGFRVKGAVMELMPLKAPCIR